MANKRYRTDDGSVYEIPDNVASSFLKKHPSAKEVRNYKTAKGEYEIPLDEVDAFETKMGLKKKESSQASPSPSKNTTVTTGSPSRSNSLGDIEMAGVQGDPVTKSSSPKGLFSIAKSFFTSDGQAETNKRVDRQKQQNIDKRIEQNKSSNPVSTLGDVEPLVEVEKEIAKPQSNIINGRARKEDLDKLKQFSPERYKELEGLVKGKPLAQTDIVAATNSYFSEQKKLANRLNSQKQTLSSYKGATNLGVDVSKSNNSDYVNTVTGQLKSQMDAELVAIEDAYPQKYEMSGGLPGPTRDFEKESKIAEVRRKYQNMQNDLGRVHAIESTKDYNSNDKAEVVGEKYAKIADPELYSLYIQSGKKSPKAAARIVKYGIDILNGTAKDNDARIADITESTFNTLHPQDEKERIYHILGAEYYKSKGSNWFLTRRPSIKELDQIASEVLTDDELEFYKSHNRIEEKNRIFGTNVPLSGAINKLGENVLTTLASTGATYLDWAQIRGREDQAYDVLEGQPISMQNVGEDVGMKSRLDELKKKPKKTFDDIQEINRLNRFVGVKSDVSEFFDSSFGIGGQVLAIAGGSKGIGSFAKGIGLANTADKLVKAEKLAGAWLGYAQTYDAARQDLLRLKPDASETELTMYGGYIGIINAASENIFRDAKVLEAFNRTVAPEAIAIFNQLNAGGLSNASRNELSGKLGKLVLNSKEFGEAYLKNNAQEVTEEVATQIGTSIADYFAAPEKFDMGQEWDKVKATAYDMAIGGSLVAIPGAMADYNNSRSNRVTIPMLNRLGYDADLRHDVKDIINEQEKAGIITPQVAAEKHAIVNTLEDIHNTTVRVSNEIRPLSKIENEKITALALKKRQADARIKSGKYDDFKEFYQKVSDDAKSEINRIVGKELIVDGDYNTMTVDEYNAKNQANDTESDRVSDTEVPTNVKPEGVQEQPNAVDRPDTQTENDKLVDAKIESAVIEIGGKQYEGKNHAEAILNAKADGQDISQVDRQAQGQFKLSDGTIIDRAEAKTRFGQDRSELLIPQDEAAKQANAEYAKEPSSRLQENGIEAPATSNQSQPLVPKRNGDFINKFFSDSEKETYAKLDEDSEEAKAMIKTKRDEIKNSTGSVDLLAEFGKTKNEPFGGSPSANTKNKTDNEVSTNIGNNSVVNKNFKDGKINEAQTTEGQKDVLNEKSGVGKTTPTSFLNELTGNPDAVTVSGLTEDARKRQIEKRVKELTLTDAEKRENEVMSLVERFNNLPNGRLGKGKTEGVQLLNQIRLLAKANKFITEGGGASQKITVKKRLANGKIGKITRKQKDTGRRSIAPNGKAFHERPDAFQREFMRLIDSNIPFDFRNTDGSLFSESQFNSALDDIYNGVTSENAEYVLNHVEKAIETGMIEYGSKSQGFGQISLEDAMREMNDLVMEDMFKNMSDDEIVVMYANELERQMVEADEQERFEIENENIIQQEYDKINNAGEVPETTSEDTKGSSTKNEVIPDETGSETKAAEKEQVVEQPKEEQGNKEGAPTKKATRKIRDEKAKKEIDDAWKDFMGDSGLLTSGGLDPKKLEAGTRLISLYIKQGVYKFSDIAQDAYAKFGSKLADIMDELKAVYSAYYNTTSDEIAMQMDSNVRGVSYEKIVGEVEIAEVPKEVFTKAIQDRIENGDKLNIIQLRKTANDVGYKFNSDTELQEHTEVAIINIAKGITEENISQQEKFDKIVALYESQPTMSMRSADRIENQQYSTPIPMSFVAGEFVNEITPKTILEPSAGNGMMVFNTNHSNVIANEIDKVRLSNLQNKGFKLVTNHNALLPFNIGKVDAVVMNPPFGKAEQKLYGDAYKVSGLDPQMVINALNSMKDDGRASIVIGGHNEYESNGALKKDKAFLNYLYNYYNVSDIVNVAGDLYSKQGTSFPTRMIFINGRRTDTSIRRFAPLGTETNSAVVKTFDELYNRVKSIQNETISSPTVSDNNIDAGQQPDNNANGTDIKKGSRKVNTTVGNGRRKADSNIGGSFGNEQRNDGSGVAGSNNGIQSNNTPPISNQRETNVQSAESPRTVRRENPILIPGRVIGTPRTIDESKEKTEYVPQSNSGKIGSVLPTNMASPLESILSQFEDIDGYVMDRLQYPSKEELYQALAAEQVDSVALGIYQIENGNALIIGDQTGVGKGRQAAALIRYGVLNGYKPIFLTEKPHLFSDIYRDMRDIGSGQMNPFIINDKSADSDPSMTDEAGAVIYKPLSSASKKPIYAKGEIPEEYDYVVVTYSQLSGSIDKVSAKKEFFASIASDNIIIADESHNAGGAGNTGQFLQNIVPTTKGMVFLSGTFAKRPDNMPIYALKTGMSEANMSSSEMAEAIQKGGVPLQEIMSKGLVDLGQMVRRERDFTGVNIDWETLSDSKESHAQTFNAVIDIFNDLIHFQREHITPIVEQLNDMMKAEHGGAEKTKGTSDLGVSNTPFASKTFNLVRQLLLSLKAEDVSRETISELRAGRKPVIAIANTMESFLKDMNIQDGDVLGNVDYSLTLKKGLDGLFRYTERDFSGNPVYKYLSVNDLSEEGKTIYNDLVKKIKQASSGITISPIDVIKKRIREAGYKVGEMTGRDIELDIQDNGGAIVSKRTDKNKKKLARDFNAGDIDVLIINQSGSTGISLHASEKFNDKRQRVMLSAQTQLDVNTEIQLRGRIDRTGQLVRGAYRYIISPIPAEQRLIMMFKAKLKSLDANTTSSQKSKTNEIEVVDFLNKYGDEIVTEYLKENRNINDKLLDPLGFDSMSDESVDELEKVDGASNKVSGRVALLNVAEQEAFYNEVSERYTSHLKYLEDNNANDLEIKVLPLEAEVKDKKVIVSGSNNGNPFSENSWLETAEVNVLRKPMTQAEIKAEMATYMEGKDNQGYKADNISKIEQYFDQQITTEADKITEDYKRKEKRITDIARNEAIKAGVDVDKSVKEAVDKLNEARDLRIQMSNAKRNNIKNNVTRVINGLNTGQSYLVPNSVTIGTDTTYSDGIFIGLKMKPKLTPSNITAVFATLDGRRKVEVPLSKTPYLNAVIGQSNLGYSQVNLENWDTKTSNKTRRTAHILTGNILQAFAVNKGGQLVTFTTKDGGLRQGILMPENYNPEKQKTRVQIIAGLSKLESGISLVDTSKDVEFIPVGGNYELRVPLSRKQGGKYFLDDKLRDMVKNRAFNQSSNKMVAEVSSNRISDVLQYLSVHHNTSLEIDSRELDINTSKFQKVQAASQSLYEEKDSGNELNGSIVNDGNGNEYRLSADSSGNKYLSLPYVDYGARKNKNFNTVETVWRESKYMDFTSPLRVTGHADVAEIFKQLEDASVEHGYAVHIDGNGDHHIQMLSIGTSTQTLIDPKVVLQGVEKFGSKKIYLVHNHPSGRINPSEADLRLTKVIRDLLEKIKVPLEHVIMDTYRMEYSYIDSYNEVTTYQRDKYDTVNTIPVYVANGQKIISEPFMGKKLTNSTDVFTAIQQLHFTAFPKNAMLVLNNTNEIIGNVVLGAKIQYSKILAAIGKSPIAKSVIFYGNQNNITQINEIKLLLSKSSVDVLDYIIGASDGAGVVGMYKSMAEEGLLREHHVEYGTNTPNFVMDTGVEYGERYDLLPGNIINGVIALSNNNTSKQEVEAMVNRMLDDGKIIDEQASQIIDLYDEISNDNQTQSADNNSGDNGGNVPPVDNTQATNDGFKFTDNKNILEVVRRIGFNDGKVEFDGNESRDKAKLEVGDSSIADRFRFILSKTVNDAKEVLKALQQSYGDLYIDRGIEFIKWADTQPVSEMRGANIYPFGLSIEFELNKMLDGSMDSNMNRDEILTRLNEVKKINANTASYASATLNQAKGLYEAQKAMVMSDLYEGELLSDSEIKVRDEIRNILNDKKLMEDVISDHENKTDKLQSGSEVKKEPKERKSTWSPRKVIADKLKNVFDNLKEKLKDC